MLVFDGEFVDIVEVCGWGIVVEDIDIVMFGNGLFDLGFGLFVVV